MISLSELENLGRRNGTPLFVVDHEEIRKNYQTFKKYLPRVEPYYAIKANAIPEVIETLFHEGASFDVASWQEFKIINKSLTTILWPCMQQYTDWIHDKIIYSNCIKSPSTLQTFACYNPLMTFDNSDEIQKIKENAPNSRLVLRLRVCNEGAMVELSSKFGALRTEALDLILEAERNGLTVEGISFHVGSQTHYFDNYTSALDETADVFNKAKEAGYTKLKLVDIGGGFPAPYDFDPTIHPFAELAKIINKELDRPYSVLHDARFIAEPGRFIVATACYAVAEVLGVANRNGKKCYYIDDGVYHTYSGTIYDHCKYILKSFKDGPTEPSIVYGPCCDALDMISANDNLPELKRGDLVYSDMVGAYTLASASNFNGFPPARVVHVNL
jgi:ornithine decarboxylase